MNSILLARFTKESAFHLDRDVCTMIVYVLHLPHSPMTTECIFGNHSLMESSGVDSFFLILKMWRWRRQSGAKYYLQKKIKIITSNAVVPLISHLFHTSNRWQGAQWCRESTTWWPWQLVDRRRRATSQHPRGRRSSVNIGGLGLDSVREFNMFWSQEQGKVATGQWIVYHFQRRYPRKVRRTSILLTASQNGNSTFWSTVTSNEKREDT